MKKIILLLTVLTLGVIACDKNELGMDMDGSSINPIEAKVEMSNNDILDIVNDILNIDVIKGSKKGNLVSTAKDADRVTMHLFKQNDILYTTYLSDDNDDLCLDNTTQTIVYLVSVHLNNSSGNIEVTLNEETTPVTTVYGDFSSLFTAPLNLLMKFDANNVIESQVVFDDNNSATFGN